MPLEDRAEHLRKRSKDSTIPSDEYGRAGRGPLLVLALMLLLTLIAFACWALWGV